MRALLASGFILGMGILLVSPTCKAASQGTPTPVSSGYVGGSLCTKPDQIVFSCPLEKSEKIVSICAVNTNREDHFYYSFGKQGSPELIFPPKNDPDKSISIAHLGFAGASGGIAYSFISGPYKYIAYHISGSGFENGGLMVTKNASKSEVINLKCRDGHIIDGIMNAPDNSLYKKLSRLPSDQELSKSNLPFAPKD